MGVEFSRSYEEGAVKESKITLRYFQGGFVFQMPIFCYNKSESTSGMMMTYALYSALNGIAYWGLSRYQKSNTKVKNSRCEMAFNFYRSKLETVEEYLQKNSLYYNKSLNEETRRRGLVIKEAYFGLAEHVYHIEAGLASGQHG